MLVDDVVLNHVLLDSTVETVELIELEADLLLKVPREHLTDKRPRCWITCCLARQRLQVPQERAVKRCCGE